MTFSLLDVYLITSGHKECNSTPSRANMHGRILHLYSDGMDYQGPMPALDMPCANTTHESPKIKHQLSQQTIVNS